MVLLLTSQRLVVYGRQRYGIFSFLKRCLLILYSLPELMVNGLFISIFPTLDQHLRVVTRLRFMCVILSVHVHEPTGSRMQTDGITYVKRRQMALGSAWGSLVLLLELRSFTLICGMWGTEKGDNRKCLHVYYHLIITAYCHFYFSG